MRETTTNRRTYLATTGAATAAFVGLAGCTGAGTGTLATYVTDQPGDIADFESCVVTIVGMWLGPALPEPGADQTTAPPERAYHAFDDPQAADLVDLQDGETQLVSELTLEPASYQFLQLDVDDVDATLENGDSAEVEVPGEAPLTFNEAFEVREDTRTAFTADFTPVTRGEAGGYLLQPVAEGIEVTYADEE